MRPACVLHLKNMVMTEENKKLFDSIIDSLHLEQATGKNREELHKIINIVAVKMDLCYVLADVIDSIMLDIDDEVKKVIDPFDERDRCYLKEMRKLVGAARKWALMATRGLYHHDSSDDFCGESDWWKNLILMVEDRTGNDELKTKQVIEWIAYMPSVLGLFDKISTKDFKRLIK